MYGTNVPRLRPPLPPPCLRTYFPQKNEMRKNWVDLMYWCAQVRDRASDVFTAIENVEKKNGAEVSDQQCRKDHASGTRAQDSGTILRLLQENTESYTRTNFNHYLDRLVLLKVLDFHIRHKSDHAKGMNFKFEIDGTTMDKKFEPHELVHPDWRMLLLVAHCHFLRQVRCHTLHVRSCNVSPSRSVHGTNSPVPSMGPIVFVSCLATYPPPRCHRGRAQHQVPGTCRHEGRPDGEVRQ